MGIYGNSALNCTNWSQGRDFRLIHTLLVLVCVSNYPFADLTALDGYLIDLMEKNS